LGEVSVRDASREDAHWVEELLVANWGAPEAVSRGVVHRPAELPGLVAERDGARRGLLTYRREGDACEIVTLDALDRRAGIGTALIDALIARLHALGVKRLWLITTNDNLEALRFYQRRGFVLAALHPGAIEASRRLKPVIPLVGHDGIPIRDELELERLL
jgi:ribosomal protein S18 acetylase RimI-like enzyme